MGEIYMSGGRRGEAAERNGMRLLRHRRGNPDTELCRNTKQTVPSSTRPYHRFGLGISNEPADHTSSSGESSVTVEELAAGYLTYVKARQQGGYNNLKIIVGDFLLALFCSVRCSMKF